MSLAIQWRGGLGENRCGMQIRAAHLMVPRGGLDAQKHRKKKQHVFDIFFDPLGFQLLLIFGASLASTCPPYLGPKIHQKSIQELLKKHSKLLVMFNLFYTDLL